MSRLEDETQDFLRSVLKADEYARVQAQQTAQKRAYRQGRRPKKECGQGLLFSSCPLNYHLLHYETPRV